MSFLAQLVGHRTTQFIVFLAQVANISVPISQVFDLYDSDRNGKLQYSEMNNFMKDLFMRLERSKKDFKTGLTEKEMYKYSQDVAKLIQK